MTDVVMPGISGPDLAGKIRAQRPDLPVVLMTGYGADLLDGVPEDIPLLAKPLELDRLIETLDRLLVR